MLRLPKVIQTDQGTNFTSRLFEKLVNELRVEHEMSSVYQPELQGVLEHFHQTLVDGLPLLILMAIRSTVQEPLGFSPAELVFGHTV